MSYNIRTKKYTRKDFVGKKPSGYFLIKTGNNKKKIESYAEYVEGLEGVKKDDLLLVDKTNALGKNKNSADYYLYAKKH